jgi:hypothetical protein
MRTLRTSMPGDCLAKRPASGVPTQDFKMMLRRQNVGRGTLVLDQLADSVGVVCLVSKHDGARPVMVEQRVGDLPVVRLSGGQAEPDREPLRIDDDDVDLGRKPAA